MVPLSNDYQLPDGILDNSSELVSKIDCIVRTGNPAALLQSSR